MTESSSTNLLCLVFGLFVISSEAISVTPVEGVATSPNLDLFLRGFCFNSENQETRQNLTSFELEQHREACSAAVLFLATLTAREAESRIPPKLLKVASGASKALYARGYGYSVIPIPEKILLQANVARREVHHPRPPRRTKRPRRGKRPPVPYASKYQNYRPSRKRRPPPQIRDSPDYRDQQDLDEDFEYDDRNYKEFEDFVSKHSELYADGYNTRGKPSRGRYKDEDGAYTENSGSYSRRPRPNLKNWTGGRPTTKLYSAAIALPSRPIYQRDEIDYDEEEYDPYDSNRDNHYNQVRYRDEDDRYNDDRYNEREEDRGTYTFRDKDRYHDWNPDEVYHDRNYRIQQDKYRRTAIGKSKDPIYDQNKRTKSPLQIEHDQDKKPINFKYNDRNRYQIASDKGRWKNILDPPKESFRTESPIVEPTAFSDTERWRGPTAPGLGAWKEPKRSDTEDWREHDIITKQNAGSWEDRYSIRQSNFNNKDTKKGNPNSWMEEHSVGYGIEIEGGQRNKKVTNNEPDVVYGQSVYSKPRVPDLGYGQGMENMGEKQTGWQLYRR